MAIENLEVTIAAQLGRDDSLRDNGGIGLCIYRCATPVAAIHRRKELATASYLEAVAVGIAPDFLQAQEVRRVPLEKFFDFFKTFGSAVFIPTDKSMKSNYYSPKRKRLAARYLL